MSAIILSLTACIYTLAAHQPKLPQAPQFGDIDQRVINNLLSLSKMEMNSINSNLLILESRGHPPLSDTLAVMAHHLLYRHLLDRQIRCRDRIAHLEDGLVPDNLKK